MRDFTKITEGYTLRYTLKKITGSNVEQSTYDQI